MMTDFRRMSSKMSGLGSRNSSDEKISIMSHDNNNNSSSQEKS